MDISSDSKLIATCSADKNVKIWGLDFGDCHKSFFAHQDSVMQVVFQRNSHNFFSAGKDRLIKYWDGDKFENIIKMDGHFGEIWALAVGGVSEIVVSASHDKSIRVWEQTDDEVQPPYLPQPPRNILTRIRSSWRKSAKKNLKSSTNQP